MQINVKEAIEQTVLNEMLINLTDFIFEHDLSLLPHPAKITGYQIDSTVLKIKMICSGFTMDYTITSNGLDSVVRKDRGDFTGKAVSVMHGHTPFQVTLNDYLRDFGERLSENTAQEFVTDLQKKLDQAVARAKLSNYEDWF